MPRYILAIDQSTSATKAVLFDEQARLVCRKDRAHAQIHAQPGWLEHDPGEIYANTVAVIKEVLEASGADKKDVAAIAITNQRETAMLWDGLTGKPIANAVVWQCCRAEGITKREEIASRAEYVNQATGLTLSPYFSAAKARWIIENSDMSGKRPMFGTMDSWLLYKLTGVHATDYSNASRTQLFNINTLEWDDALIRLFGLEDVSFPEVMCSDRVFGATTVEGYFDTPVPVAGLMGDSHGALFGQHCWKQGMGKATFGTGSSVMINVGSEPVRSKNGLATSIAWGMDGRVEYVLEGNIICTGDTIKWLKDELGVLESSGMSEVYAKRVPSSEGVYLVPAFVGLGAPYWNSSARAIICGLFRDANKYHVVRAGLEAIAYQIKDVITPIEQDAGIALAELRVDGGPTNNGFLMQFTADMLRTRIVKNTLEELSALGAAYAAGLAVGVWKSKAELESFRRAGEAFEAEMDAEKAGKLYGGWKNAVAMINRQA